MDSKSLFIEAVEKLASLPTQLRENAVNVTALELHKFDESYIDFLDTQIRLSPRGPEWTARLMDRRTAFLPFCGLTLLRGTIHAENTDYFIEVHPETKTVIHWEGYVEI